MRGERDVSLFTALADTRHGLALTTDGMTQTWTSEGLNLIAVSPSICQSP